ncbi:MAG: hypothetical protein P4L79_10320 [Legionella sp.]|uniref:hypothetical protein n=1 Tax=Legionella sp. TaxID=459 RepID=UPI00283D6900|nr:hypothetical protein [Legionella sp.]
MVTSINTNTTFLSAVAAMSAATPGGAAIGAAVNAAIVLAKEHNPSGSAPQLSLNNQSTYSILRYPPDGGVYYMSLFISEYVRPSMLASLQLNSTSTICLPVPGNLTDAQTLQFSVTSRNAAVGLAEQNSSAAGSAASSGVGMAAGAAERGAAAGLDTMISGAGSSYLQSMGIAPNPFLTVLFESPNFKEHQFSWRFSPKTPQESVTIKKIVNTLKYHSLPAIGGGAGAFFKYPDIIQPALYPNPDSLYVFQPCVVKDIAVNYAPSGIPSFFQGTQAPVEIELKISLMELSLWLKNTYDTTNVAF